MSKSSPVAVSEGERPAPAIPASEPISPDVLPVAATATQAVAAAQEAVSRAAEEAARETAPSVERKHTGGWPKGKPRGPRPPRTPKPSATAAAPLPDDVAERIDTLERQNAELTGTVAVLEAGRSEELRAAAAGAFAGLIMLTGEVLSWNLGTHWIIPEEEAAPVGQLCANAAAPYLGSMLKYLPVALAIGALGKLAVPRMQIEREIRLEQRTRVLARRPGDVASAASTA